MRRSRILAAFAAAALITGVASANAAGSTQGRHGVRVTLNGHSYLVSPGKRMGVKLIHPGTRTRPAANTLSLHSNSPTGAVSPKPKVYLVFWGSQWSSDPAGAAPAMQNFFQGLHGKKDPWGMIMNQYCEGLPVGTTNCGNQGTHIKHPKKSPLAGVWFDNATAAPTNATAAQIAAEAANAATHFNNTTQAPNLNAQYVIASATGTHPDGFPNSGFCAYHSSTSSADGRLAYTNLPYVPDLGAGACTTIGAPTILDGYFSTETHEYAEVLTDFFPSAGWLGGGGEIGDACVQLDARETLSTGTFDVQGLWSNSANKCVTAGP